MLTIYRAKCRDNIALVKDADKGIVYRLAGNCEGAGIAGLPLAQLQKLCESCRITKEILMRPVFPVLVEPQLPVKGSDAEVKQESNQTSNAAASAGFMLTVQMPGTESAALPVREVQPAIETGQAEHSAEAVQLVNVQILSCDLSAVETAPLTSFTCDANMDTNAQVCESFAAVQEPLGIVAAGVIETGPTPAQAQITPTPTPMSTMSTPITAAPLSNAAISAPVSNPFCAAAAVADEQKCNLLTELLLGVGGEELVSVDEALAGVEGIIGGPSQGGFSWHTLALCMECWRKAFYSLVWGLVKKQGSKALQFGSLYHACWELWYRFGGSKPWDAPCEAVRRAGAPKLAGEVQRLFYMELQKYAAQEAAEWDIRAVEQNAYFFSDPQRINGKVVHIPFSCRHDGIIAKRAPGQPCAPLGPVPQGAYILDRKTASALSYDLTKGYAMDGQFLMNAKVYKSVEEDLFGRLIGMIFSVAVKHKDPTPDKSFFRVETIVDNDTLEEFYQHELIPYGTELYRKLFGASREDMAAWPKNHAACVGRYGCCEFFDICDVGGSVVRDALFVSDPKRIFTIDKLAEPSIAKTSATKQVKSVGRCNEKKKIADAVLEAFRCALLTLPKFQSDAYLVPGHNEKKVLDALIATMHACWPPGAFYEVGEEANVFHFGPDAAGRNYLFEVKDKGFSWKLLNSEKKIGGTLNYTSIAKAVCRDWWDVSKNTPTLIKVADNT